MVCICKSLNLTNCHPYKIGRLNSDVMLRVSIQEIEQSNARRYNQHAYYCKVDKKQLTKNELDKTH